MTHRKIKLNELIPDGTQIRFKISNPDYDNDNGIFNMRENMILHKGKKYKSLSTFAKSYNKRSVNGWTKCEVYIDEQWIIANDVYDDYEKKNMKELDQSKYIESLENEIKQLKIKLSQYESVHKYEAANVLFD